MKGKGREGEGERKGKGEGERERGKGRGKGRGWLPRSQRTTLSLFQLDSFQMMGPDTRVMGLCGGCH